MPETAPPTALSATMALPAQPEPMVINLAKCQSLRTIEALSNSGVIKNDTDRMKIQLLKRINHAAKGDYSDSSVASEFKQMQADFGTALKKPYEQMVADGDVNKLLDRYLELLVKDNEHKIAHLTQPGALQGDENEVRRLEEMLAQAEIKKKKYADERAEYAKNEGYGEFPSMQQTIKNVAAEFKDIVSSDRFMPLGEVAAQSKLADAAAVKEVIGTQAARGLAAIVRKFFDKPTLESYNADPTANSVRIAAQALRIVRQTDPLKALKQVELENRPELDRIIALKALVSAQLNAALTMELDPKHALQVETDALAHGQQAASTAMNLALANLEKSAPNSARAKTMADNLREEMRQSGIAVVPEADAIAQAAAIAAKSAKDVLRMAGDDMALASKISQLAQAAGAAGPLQPEAHLIAEKFSDMVEREYGKGNVAKPTPTDVSSFVQKYMANANSPVALRGL